MIYDFKIHAVDRNNSAMGQVEADNITDATTTALESYAAGFPGSKVIHITVEDTEVMPERRKQWERES